MDGTLYTFPENFRAYKILIAAQYSGANIKVLSDPPAFIYGTTNQSEEFLKKFPLGKVPAFESDDGVELFESNAIAYYVANATLRGSAGIQDAAYVQQWMEFADSEILPAAFTWVFPAINIMQFNKQNSERAKEDVKLVLATLNEHLVTRTYLVGERITLADICVASNLLLLYQWVLDPSFRRPYENANRWFTTLVNQPQFKAVVGDFQLCEKMAQFDPKKFDELHGHKMAGKKQDKSAVTKDRHEKKDHIELHMNDTTINESSTTPAGSTSTIAINSR